jgi:hypothetical protein
MSAGNPDSSRDAQPCTFGRRGFLKRAPMLVVGTQAGSVLASMLGEGHAATQADTGKGAIADIVVETTAGRIRGTNVKGIRTFKGVPYGASTEGSHRFMPPRKPVAWTGVRDTLSLGPSSPQLPGFKTPEIQMMQNLASNPSSEDCLVLNVWTPGTDNARRPVMFWLHGGGFQFGSGGQPFFDGANLARRGDVVTVTINHRLGCLGYLHLGDLGGPAFAKSGNVGMLDAVAALANRAAARRCPRCWGCLRPGDCFIARRLKAVQDWPRRLAKPRPGPLRHSSTSSDWTGPGSIDCNNGPSKN